MDTIGKFIVELISLLKQYLALPKPEPVVIPEHKPIQTLPSAPVFVTVAGTKYKTHGHYATPSGKAKGLVVHYTVSGRSPASAKGVVQYLAKEGLGCMVMDENGTIYVPEGFNYLTDVAYHAGQSAWLGKTGISGVCMGMEMCNWGTDGKKQGASDLRVALQKHDNIKPGTYQAYTAKQEKALIDFCHYMKKINPEFSYDWVVGHDEIAPTRKSDPGASLSMSMPELRKLLKGT